MVLKTDLGKFLDVIVNIPAIMFKNLIKRDYFAKFSAAPSPVLTQLMQFSKCTEKCQLADVSANCQDAF